jgi:hypothetical protein
MHCCCNGRLMLPFIAIADWDRFAPTILIEHFSQASPTAETSIKFR